MVTDKTLDLLFQIYCTIAGCLIAIGFMWIAVVMAFVDIPLGQMQEFTKVPFRLFMSGLLMFGLMVTIALLSSIWEDK